MRVISSASAIILFSFCLFAPASPSAGTKQKPLMKDFAGINGHFHFKPELYSKVCRLARNYHNINWDVKAPGDPVTVPICPNKVNWEKNVYEPWAKAGFETDLCAQFGSFGRENKDYAALWKGKEEWAFQYGKALASYFGPSGTRKLVTSIEIGNEPGEEFDDKLYSQIFMNMARGIRKGDPGMKIVTCTAQTGKPDKYSKSLEETFSSPEIKALYDVINVHVYAIKLKSKDYSPWDRSYPEDPKIDYLKNVDAVINWRNNNAKDKQIWITEFGYDTCTPAAMQKRDGWFQKLNWQGVTDLQQAQYLVRSLLCFAERDIDRAYIYFYNDEDKASVHASSGITRNFAPKPSYWALKQFYEILGNFRFNRAVSKNNDDLYVYEFKDSTDKAKTIWAVWSPTGQAREKSCTLTGLPGKLISAEPMQVSDKASGAYPVSSAGSTSLSLKIQESPVYLTFENPLIP